jgi:hypothetical protein
MESRYGKYTDASLAKPLSACLFYNNGAMGSAKILLFSDVQPTFTDWTHVLPILEATATKDMLGDMISPAT